jgi:hypothetical protein
MGQWIASFFTIGKQVHWKWFGSSAIRVSRVPPIKFKLCYLAPNGDGRSFSYVPLQQVEIKPGETTTVDYSEEGMDVIARLRWPDGFTRQKEDHLFAVIHTPAPQPPRELANDAEGLRMWRETPEIAAQIGALKSWMMRETPEG